jgi:hypothetical protein
MQLSSFKTFKTFKQFKSLSERNQPRKQTFPAPIHF